MKEKIIIIVVPRYMSYKVFLKDFCSLLITSGWQVYVFTKLPKDYKTDKDPVIFIDFDFPRKFEIQKYITSSRKLKKLVHEIKPTIVHAHFQSAAFVVRLAMINKLTITLTTSHGLIFNTMDNKIKSILFKYIEIFIYKTYHKVWVLTKSDQLSLSKYLPSIEAYPTKGLGCNLDNFQKSNFEETINEKLKFDLGISNNDFVYIFVGRLTSFKGISEVFNAFKIINNKYNATKLIILGDFDSIHPSGLTETELLELKNNKNIKRMGFTLEVGKYLAISNVLVFPSNKEGMPVNLMEAICMGVPIVTLNSRGCVDIVEDKYGLVLDEKNIESISKAMEKLLIDKALLKKIGDKQLNDRYLFDRKLFFKYQISEYEHFIKIN